MAIVLMEGVRVRRTPNTFDGNILRQGCMGDRKQFTHFLTSHQFVVLLEMQNVSK